jgi:DNA replication regulator SLD3
MLKIMELEKRFMTLNKIELPKPQKKKPKKKKAQGKEDLDQQLELYFERLCIWDSMMDTSQSASDATIPKLPQKGTDDVILQLRVLCKCLSDM